ncbi:enoyl-CoA hydratase/isomerase family protein [Chloroflexota bacterium]
MNYEAIILEKKEHIATITLNRPEKLNALGDGMVPEILSALADVGDDDEMRVLVLTGAGRGFCSGGDAKGMSEGEQRGTGTARGSEAHRRGLARGLQGITRGLQKMEKPTIAMVNGVAAGPGCDIALACDLRIGSENARFVNVFIRTGFAPGLGGTWLYPQVMGLGRALQYLFTGDFIEAKEAERIGVLNYLVPAEELEKETMILARKIASGPPIAMRLTKLQAYKGLTMDFDTALQVAAACQTITFDSEDSKEGLKAFVEKRQAIFKGR